MKKKGIIVMLSICLFLTVGCGKVAELKNGEQVVGKINGKTVTANDLYEELKNKGGTSVFINMIDDFIANKEIKDSDSIKTEAKSQLDQLKAQYENAGQDFKEVLKNAGYANEDALLKVLILDIKKNKVVENFLKDHITDDEINDYYDTNIEGELTARHILITPEVKEDMTEEETSKAKENAKKKAENILKKLEKGEKFEDLAKKNSDDEGRKKNGGLIENITKDTVVEPFYNATKKLKDGEYTKEVVESSYGYHIILRVSQKEKPKLKDVKEDILEDIVSDKLSSDSTLTTTTWVDIRKKYKLNIEDSKIKKEYNELNS